MHSKVDAGSQPPHHLHLSGAAQLLRGVPCTHDATASARGAAASCLSLLRSRPLLELEAQVTQVGLDRIGDLANLAVLPLLQQAGHAAFQICVALGQRRCHLLDVLPRCLAAHGGALKGQGGAQARQMHVQLLHALVQRLTVVACAGEPAAACVRACQGWVLTLCTCILSKSATGNKFALREEFVKEGFCTKALNVVYSQDL
jgi:hypothetical protein